MKQDIHPEYCLAAVKCSCGNTFETRAIVDSMSVDLCNQCHPFDTGKQKLVDAGGRVDRFKRRLEKADPGHPRSRNDVRGDPTTPRNDVMAGVTYATGPRP
ncbi:MAG: 50S ribosomal protein L31 [Nitriliruptor sp.]|nr:MAG: 50S ribosomal protein L31 [Nitriliruptor sp.]